MASVKLYISPTEDGQYLVVVDGEGFYNAPPNARVSVRIRGDDEWFDDTLFGLGGGVSGGFFNVSAKVPGSALNEDWGQDEIYAAAKVDGYGEYRSNTIKGSF